MQDEDFGQISGTGKKYLNCLKTMKAFIVLIISFLMECKMVKSLLVGIFVIKIK